MGRYYDTANISWIICGLYIMTIPDDNCSISYEDPTPVKDPICIYWG